MTNQFDIISIITTHFPLNKQIEYIKSDTNKSGGNVLPAMDNEGKLYHQRLRRSIVPLTLNFVEKDESLEWEKRVIIYSDVIKRFEEDNLHDISIIQSLNYFMIPGLSSLAMGLLNAADIKDNINLNISIPEEDTGFVTYNPQQDTLYFVIEYKP